MKNVTDDGTVEGVVKRHADGFGFLIPDNPEHPDVYIPRHSMVGVMTNDRVVVAVQPSRDLDRVHGEVVKVLQRATKRVVGRYYPVEDGKYGVIYDDAKAWGIHLRIPNEENGNAKAGDLVAAEIVRYPGRGGQDFLGKVVGLIGNAEDPLNDIKRVIYQHNISHEFSAGAVQDAQKYGGEVTDEEIKGSTNLTFLPLITIDGVTAKDFDDAICVKTAPEGFHLWVAIADVSHYVKPGTNLDREAYERGTSTYFPNFVVPMLPEELSNELCSLKPHVTRLALVAEMKINFQGEVIENTFYEGVIESKARVTYGEAQEVIDGNTPDKLKHVEETILRAADLAKILMTKRFREGSLDLEIPQTEVIVDDLGQPVDIVRSERIFAHRLIEELMLIANVSVAKHLTENEVPALYRIHEEPAAEGIQALQRFLYNFGGNRGMGGGRLQKKITRALQGFEGKPEAQILNILTLRTMMQARYSHDNIGHFGLGFADYTHFTSPIRRYPDLIVHRLLKSLVVPSYAHMRMTEDELATAGNFLSACEQRSVKAERQLISIKKTRFIEQYLGDEFEGIISSVTKFGVFVLLRTVDVDGLVKVEELGDDRFEFDPDNLRLVGRRTGLTFSIGDVVKVQVAAVDTEAGRIDFTLIEGGKISETGKKKKFSNNADKLKAKAERRKKKKGWAASEEREERGKRKESRIGGKRKKGHEDEGRKRFKGRDRDEDTGAKRFKGRDRDEGFAKKSGKGDRAHEFGGKKAKAGKQAKGGFGRKEVAIHMSDKAPDQKPFRKSRKINDEIEESARTIDTRGPGARAFSGREERLGQKLFGVRKDRFGQGRDKGRKK